MVKAITVLNRFELRCIVLTHSLVVHCTQANVVLEPS